MGQLIYIEQGFRLNFLPILGLIPIHDVNPEMTLKSKIYHEIRAMGGDALINMSLDWRPPRNGFLGILSSGGRITVYGTVIRR